MAMVAAVAIASVWPQWGRSEGVLHLGRVMDIGVFLLFFLHGMGLSTDSLKKGAAQWRLHLLVQACTYVLFPLWWALWAAVLGRAVPHDLLMGFFYLAVLPSTVSSSVAMTALARGHVAAAVLNATLSTLLGVFLTPLLVSLVIGAELQAAGQALDVGQTMLKVAQMLLLPFIVGHLLRPWLSGWFARIKPVTTVFDRGVIVLLVWSAFSDSVADGLWTRHGLLLLAEAMAGAALFLFPALWATRRLSRAIGLPVDDEIVAVFCGSKKTLASGMPMAKLLFGGSAAMGVLILPIMLYHQLQLFVCAVMARRYAARDGGAPSHRVV
ncbi:bile acid:sodium symporter family protein [Aquabacterium sp.]|uniref:bile acid:sodium symporter family protein n=1 Tax=Aquabacterium sp. TaxID=1872578 RepID=UPI0035C695FD